MAEGASGQSAPPCICTCPNAALQISPPRSQSGMLSFKADNPLTNRQWLMQAPFIVLVSAAGGLLGAVSHAARHPLAMQ
jgi:hypothetical protein